MYRVRFSPYYTKNPDRGGMHCYRVYTSDLGLMKLFLQQHKFDPEQTVIENVPYEVIQNEDKQQEDHWLSIQKIGSNIDHKIHEIATTTHLLTLACDYATNELTQCLVMGDAILRKDIQLIKLVSDILESLPMTEIVEHLLMDTQSVDDMSWMIVSKTLEDFAEEPSDVGPHVHINELLCEEWEKSDMVPITLEAYVKSFVQIIRGGM